MMLVGRTALSEEIMTKSSTPCSGGGEGDVVGAEDVVFDGLEDGRLHHGDVLVGGGVDRRRRGE